MVSIGCSQLQFIFSGETNMTEEVQEEIQKKPHLIETNSSTTDKNGRHHVVRGFKIGYC